LEAGLEAEVGLIARRTGTSNLEKVVSEEQRSKRPKIGFPEGLSAFGLRPRFSEEVPHP
jgi:hypothetical protein